MRSYSKLVQSRIRSSSNAAFLFPAWTPTTVHPSSASRSYKPINRCSSDSFDRLFLHRKTRGRSAVFSALRRFSNHDSNFEVTEGAVHERQGFRARQRRKRRQRGGAWTWTREDSDAFPSLCESKRASSRPVRTDELTPQAQARAKTLAAELVLTPPTAKDLVCIEERQLRHKAGDTVAVSPPCRHGFPQAFAFHPVGYKISSGLFRLSCPLLVKAIDKLEEDGGLEDVNDQLEVDVDLRQDFMAVNLAHGELRRRMVTGEHVKRMEAAMGKEDAELMLGSGITGVTPGKVGDAKCLHAHVADALMRGRESNAIGRVTLELLEDEGLHTSGCTECCQQCDVRIEETDITWRYTPQKNKQRLQQRKSRRKVLKAYIDAKAEDASQADCDANVPLRPE